MGKTQVMKDKIFKFIHYDLSLFFRSLFSKLPYVLLLMRRIHKRLYFYVSRFYCEFVFKIGVLLCLLTCPCIDDFHLPWQHFIWEHIIV